MSYRLPLLTVLTVLAVLGGAASAEQYRIGDLVIESPWSREMPPVAETGAVWFLVENRGAADRIVSADSPIAAETELHAHEVEDGVVKMRRLASVEVPAGSETAFAPGGRHVMLIGLEEPLVAGESFAMTVRFERAGAVEVRVRVRTSGELAHRAHSGHSDHSDPPDEPGHFFDSDPPDDALA